MNNLKIVDKKIGVIGTGSFGTAVANLIAEKADVLLFGRNPEVVDKINSKRFYKNVKIHSNILAINDLKQLAEECDLIFPIVPSGNFRNLIKELAPYVKPYHILIHGTKGLDCREIADSLGKRTEVFTMSEVIRQESSVVRIGCLSGPNISQEILQEQPAATVIASQYKEVIDIGKKVLRSKRFQVYSTFDIRGAELAGALKNIFAISAGILNGLNLGYNLFGLLITRALTEMIHFGKALGADLKPFLGVAGIGDLVTTASSPKSRNYTVGKYIADGKSLNEILGLMEEVAEGINTIHWANKLADLHHLTVPITRMMHRVLYENYDPKTAIEYLIRIDYEHDVDYL
jgi:glycerol-3-phosphate dehydrogenase (NAD(P)+)